MTLCILILSCSPICKESQIVKKHWPTSRRTHGFMDKITLRRANRCIRSTSTKGCIDGCMARCIRSTSTKGCIDGCMATTRPHLVRPAPCVTNDAVNYLMLTIRVDEKEGYINECMKPTRLLELVTCTKRHSFRDSLQWAQCIPRFLSSFN
jgi:hypothetical protein